MAIWNNEGIMLYIDRKFVSNCGVYGYTSMQVFYHFSDLLKRTVVQTISDMLLWKS